MAPEPLQTLPATRTGGRPVAQEMPEALLECLQQHLNLELNASSAYWALAIWFAERELRGFSHYFLHESNQEREHAGLIANYLIARGQPVELAEIEAPRQQWESIEEVFAAVFQKEVDVTTSLQQIYGLAEQSGDVRSTVFLDPLIAQQTNSEDTAAHLLGRIKLSRGDGAALLILDAELAADQTSPANLAS
jgi:ferritin